MSENTDILALGQVDERNSEITLLDTGAYDAACVAVTVRMMGKFQSTELEPKVQFVFQIRDGETNHYLRTMPLRIVNNTEGNLNKTMASWLKMSSEQLVGFNLRQVVGVAAQVVVDSETRNNKTYNVITNVLAARKNNDVKIYPDTLPEFLTRDCVEAVLAQSIQKGATVPAAAPADDINF